jgi:hypothetical protein
MIRTIDLLLGRPPMSQYDAAATPIYQALGATADVTPYDVRPALVDLNTKNTPKSYGSARSVP